MKNWKSKKFISGVLTVVLLGYGVANPELIGSTVGSIACGAVVQCES